MIETPRPGRPAQLIDPCYVALSMERRMVEEIDALCQRFGFSRAEFLRSAAAFSVEALAGVPAPFETLSARARTLSYVHNPINRTPLDD